MNAFQLKWSDAFAPVIRYLWRRHAQAFMGVSIVTLALYAAFKFADEFPRLIWDQGTGGAYDLSNFHRFVGDWFAGKPVTTEPVVLLYPPASMALLYPLLGWLSFEAARWLWAGLTLAALVWLIYLLAEYSGAQTHAERILVALLLLAMNATTKTVGVGELILPVLPFLIVGLFSLQQATSWRRDIIAAACLTVTLVKPNIPVPFLWLVFFSPSGWRILGLMALGYGALTLLAASYQSTPLLILMRDWLARSSSHAGNAGYGNVSIWIANLGLGEWALAGSFLVLFAIGIWTYQHRRSDTWQLLGVLGIVARMWTYHDLTDDMLVLFPMIALFRIAKFGAAVHGDDVIAGLLLTATMLMMLLPGQFYYLPPPWNLTYTIGHPLIWSLVLLFLMVRGVAPVASDAEAINEKKSAIAHN